MTRYLDGDDAKLVLPAKANSVSTRSGSDANPPLLGSAHMFRRVPQALALPLRQPRYPMDVGVATGTHWNQVHQPLVTKVLVRAVVQVKASPPRRSTAVAVLREAGSPVPIARGPPCRAVNVRLVVHLAYLWARGNKPQSQLAQPHHFGGSP